MCKWSMIHYDVKIQFSTNGDPVIYWVPIPGEVGGQNRICYTMVSTRFFTMWPIQAHVRLQLVYMSM
jgi:hypothetical protein